MLIDEGPAGCRTLDFVRRARPAARGCKSPVEVDGTNHKPRATASSRGGVGRKPEAKSRPEEQEHGGGALASAVAAAIEGPDDSGVPLEVGGGELSERAIDVTAVVGINYSLGNVHFASGHRLLLCQAGHGNYGVQLNPCPWLGGGRRH